MFNIYICVECGFWGILESPLVKAIKQQYKVCIVVFKDSVVPTNKGSWNSIACCARWISRTLKSTQAKASKKYCNKTRIVVSEDVVVPVILASASSIPIYVECNFGDSAVPTSQGSLIPLQGALVVFGDAGAPTSQYC